MDEIRQVITDRYAIYNDDCINVWRALPDNSVGLTIESPPFAGAQHGLYRYSSSPLDLSNSRGYQEFMEHYDFVIAEDFRTKKPGRVSVVHCMDVPLSNTGHGDNLIDFPASITELYTQCRDSKCSASYWEKKHGLCGHGWFGYAGKHVIWKEPLTIRNRTLAKKLAHRTIVDDSVQSGCAGADYLLVFRKRGENAEPVTHERGLVEYYGEKRPPANVLGYKGWTGKQTENKFSHWVWRQYASSVWDDVRLDYVLPYEGGTDENKDEKHVHPLQLDVIARAVELYSNPSDIVGTRFMGVGSEVYQAVKMGRFGVGAELKDTYFRQSVRSLSNLDNELDVAEQSIPTTLFEFAAMIG